MSSTDQQTAETGFSLSLTERAAQEVKQFITQEQVPEETAGIRVSVLPGGCSGFKYSLNIEPRALEDDLVIEVNDVRLFVDGFSAQDLMGMESADTPASREPQFGSTRPDISCSCC